MSIRERPILEDVEVELKQCYNCDKLLKTYEFKLEEVEGFRYVNKNLLYFRFYHRLLSDIEQKMLGKQ